MEINYEDVKTEDLGEEVEFEVKQEEKAPVYCTKCKVKMTPAKTKIRRQNIVFLDVKAFKCPRCGEEVLDIDTAAELERDFALRHAENLSGYDMKVSFDGRNYLIRFPKELSKKFSKKSRAKLMPIYGNEYVLKIED